MQVKQYEQLPQEAILLRKEVFMEEQGFLEEFDEIDKIARHLVLFCGSEEVECPFLCSLSDVPVAVCRYYFSEKDKMFHIGRIAVKKQFRGKNFGAIIIKAAEDAILAEVFSKSDKERNSYKIPKWKEETIEIRLSAQCRAAGFYEKQGYQKEGAEYLDEGCPHICMKKTMNIQNADKIS